MATLNFDPPIAVKRGVMVIAHKSQLVWSFKSFPQIKVHVKSELMQFMLLMHFAS